MSERAQSNPKTGRRKFLKYGSAGLVAGVTSLTTVAASNPTKVDIPKLISGGEVVEYLSVPEDWSEHRNYVSKKIETARAEFHNIPGVKGVELGQSSQEFGGDNGLQIFVLIDEDYSPGEVQIGSTWRSIPISKEVEPKGGPGCDDDGSADNCNAGGAGNDIVNGGEQVGWDNGGYGSATCKVEYNSSEHLLHCGHVFWDDCNDANSGGLDNRLAKSKGEKIGKTVKVDVAGDWSVIDRSEGGDYYYSIDDFEHNPTIVGYVAEEAIDRWASQSTDPCVNQAGITTGLTRERVYRSNTDYSGVSCTNFHNEGVRTKCNFAQGDSGGPTYYRDGSDAYLISVTASYLNYRFDKICNGSNLGYQSAGTSAYWLINNEPISLNNDSIKS